MPQPARAMPAPVVITPDQGAYPLARHLDLLEDTSRALTISDIVSPKNLARFVPPATDTPGFGFTSSAVWVRFSVNNSLSYRVEYFLEVKYPLLDHIDFYTPTGAGGFTVVKAGDNISFAQRFIKHKNNIFPIKLDPGEQKTFFLRCETTSSLNLPLTLHSPAHLAEEISLEQTLLGIYYGILLVMMLYNFFIYLGLKDSTYLYYVLFVFTYMLFQLSVNGMAFQYFWPDQIWWANNCTPFFIFLAYIFATQFTRKILDTPRNVPRIDVILKAGMVFSLIGAILTLIVGYQLSIRLATLVSLTVAALIVAGFICMIKGYRPARYYFLAWSVSMLGVTIYALKTFGLLPHTFITHWGIQLGSAWEVILLSMGLADRFHLMKQEKEQMQTDYARQLEEAHGELEKSFLDLERFKNSLESLVEERTADLSLVNENLAREVSDRQKAEAFAEAASNAKSQFLASMSHEIRTPLNAILGMADMAFKMAETEKLRHFLAIIQDSGKALLALINDILDFSKIEAGRLDLEHSDFDLRETMDNLADLFGRQAADKGLELLISISAGTPCALRGDALRLRQILLNLVNNAIKFTEKGEVSVTTYCEEQDTKEALLHFSVRDTGSGINHDQIRQLFSEYTQADSSTSRLYGGTGLGLAISKQLVTLMGGEISAESEPGKGSTFHFTIRAELQPAAAQTPPAPPPKDSPETENDQFKSLAGKKVLVVEDDPASQLLTSQLLTRAGILVDIAGNGKEALAALQGRFYDAVLMDITMPEMDGLAATRAIRRDLHLELPIIAVTANAIKGDREKCLEAGTDDYLTKPVEPERLYQTLARLLSSPNR